MIAENYKVKGIPVFEFDDEDHKIVLNTMEKEGYEKVIEVSPILPSRLDASDFSNKLYLKEAKCAALKSIDPDKIGDVVISISPFYSEVFVSTNSGRARFDVPGYILTVFEGKEPE